MVDNFHVFMILFLMLGPFKILGPYTRLTREADPVLARKVAIRSILISSLALLLAALLGKQVISNFAIPVPILAISGGLILFLVAIQNVISQFADHSGKKEAPEPLDIKMAMYPLAFPIIVTPYGIAAVIVFLAVTPSLEGDLWIGAMIAGIMLLNLVMMLMNRYLFKAMAFVLPVLGSILSVVQVALGLQIMYRSLMLLINPSEQG